MLRRALPPLLLFAAASLCSAATPARFRTLVLSEEFHSEGAAAADIDGDGDADIVSGPFWYEGPEFRRRHRYAEGASHAIQGYSDHFFSWTMDVDRDGRIDILSVGMPGRACWWHRNPGGAVSASDGLWRRHKILDDVGGESPVLADMDGDGREELVCVHGGGFGVARQTADPARPWSFVSVSGNQGLGVFTHGMGVGDVDGDGRVDLLETRGWWRQGERIDARWQFHAQRFAQSGGSQMFAYDFDGDGDQDVISAQNAHGWGLTWFERRGEEDDFLFVPHPILTHRREDHPHAVAFSQLHSIALADLDGDGVKDIVTGKRFWAHGGGDPGARQLPVLYWLRTARGEGGVEFQSHLLDERTGVGTQLAVADVTGDGRLDVLVGSKLGTFAVVQDSQGKAPPPSPDPLRDAAGTELFQTHIRTTDPLPPESEGESLVLPVGFQARLFAAEPQIAKPMNMAFDDRGRLWVSSSTEYPIPAPADREPRDTIKILEDTDGDDRADKVTTFADKLNIPMGLYPYGDGVVCFSIPDILFLRDTDGDGRADRRQRLYGPFDTSRDTHGMCNAFTRGYDGWLYSCHGFNNQSVVAGADGHQVTLRSGNVFRFRLDGSRIEHVGRGQVNPFGMTIDRYGDVLTADCHTKPINLVLPGGWHDSFGAPHDGLGYVPNVMGHLHGSTGIAGIALGSSLRFPAAYADSTFGGNVVTGRINRNHLRRDAGTLRAVEAPDFVIAGDPWFRPVDLQPGPDGALYVADFYNRIIGHYEVKLDHPGRDRHRGRIWRISCEPTDRRRDPSPDARSWLRDLTESTTAELLQHAADAGPDQQRRVVNYLCDERPGEAAREARRTIDEGRVDAAAIWVLARTAGLDDSDIERAFLHGGEEARCHGVHAAAHAAASAKWIVRGLHDASPQVRRAAAIAAARRVDPRLADALLAAHRQAEPDGHLSHAIRIALKRQLSDAEIFRRVAAEPRHAALLSEICLALKSPAAGDYLAGRLLELATGDRQRLLEYAAFAARYGGAESTAALAEAIPRRLKDDPDGQLKLLFSIDEGVRQRGHDAPAVRAWALQLARRLYEEGKAAGDPLQWAYIPAGPSPQPENCWVLSQRRRSADGMSETPLLSSFPLGEFRTGIYRSQSFSLGESFRFFVAGHDGFPGQALQGRNFVRLRLAKSHEVLHQAAAPRNDTAQAVEWDTSSWRGKSAYVELVDTDAGRAYAWLAAGRFSETRLNPSASAARRKQAARLAARFRLHELHAAMAEQLREASGETAAAAAEALAEMDGDSRLRAAAVALRVAGLPADSQERGIRALTGHDGGAARAVIGAAMAAATAKEQSQIASQLLTERRGLETLLQLVESGRAAAALLASPQAREQVEAVAGPGQLERADAIGEQAPSEPQRIAERIGERTRSYLDRPGAASSGARIFEKNCAACHQVAGKGKKVGPNLDGIGSRGLQRLVEDLLAPNRNVDVAFRATIVVTDDGEALRGAVKSEDGAQLVLVDSQGREVVVPKAAVARRKKSTLSPMPENFAETIGDQQFRDLMAYLLSLR